MHLKSPLNLTLRALKGQMETLYGLRRREMGKLLWILERRQPREEETG